MVRREKSNYAIQSVSHALDVLEQFSGEHDELGVTDLSKRLKLHKNNVFRLLATLEARGYIEQNKATENYRLGARCLRLGQRFVGQLGILKLARPVMRRVADTSRETTFIALLRNGAIVPMDAAEPEQAVRLVTRIGDPLPAHCTAVGKVLLAFGDNQLRSALLPGTLTKYTEKTITDSQILLQQLGKISESSYAIELGEHIEDVRSVAVAVRDYTRVVVGSVAIAGPAYRLSHERIEKEIVPLMVDAARELSSRLGFESSV